MACDPFTGVMLPLEPNHHTTRGIRARTAPSSLQQCSDKTDISAEKAQFPLFHRPWSEVGTSARSGILRRFHGGFPLFRWSKSVPPRRKRASGRFETPGPPDRILGHIGGGGMRVAVIGTGIAGNAAAWTLSKCYPVTVYDRELRPGGHSHTVTIDYDGSRIAVDIGFNELNYPDLTALFSHLGAETDRSRQADRCCCTAIPVCSDTPKISC